MNPTGSGATAPQRAAGILRSSVLFVALLGLPSACSRGSAPEQPPGGNVPGGVETQALSVMARSGRLFTRLSPDEVGVAHQNTLPLERTGNYLHVGAGVAAGDYDGDGLVDLFLVSQTLESKLFRNLGGWRFQDVTAPAGIAIDRRAHTGRWDERFPTGAQFVDADDDGDLDLFVTAFAGSTTYFENRGDGRFRDATETSGLRYEGASTASAFGDIDRDGDLDLYLTTYRPYGEYLLYPPGSEAPDPALAYDKDESGRLLAERDVMFRNDKGQFVDITTESGLEDRAWGLAARFAHLNGDLWPDLYVANDFETPDRLLVNDRTGRLGPLNPAAYGLTPFFSMGMDVGDVNNDGLMDILASDMLSPDRLHRQTQSMHGVIPDGVQPPADGAAQVMRNTLLVNHGNGTFSDVAAFAGVTASDWTWTVKLADLDLDGFNDVLITNGFVQDVMNIDEGLQLTKMKQQGQTQEVLAFLRSRPPLLTPNIIYRNNGDLTFESVAAKWGFDDSSIGQGAALADLDNDGDLDVVVNNLNAPVGIYRNDADGNRIKITLIGDASNSRGLGARLTLETAAGMQVKEMSSSGGYLSGHEPVVIFGIGALPGASTLTVEWPSGHVSQVADLAANTSLVVREPAGAGTIVEPPDAAPPQFQVANAYAGISFAHRESTYDDFADQPLLPERMSRYGPGVAWGDADGDGDDDLAIAGGRGQAGEVLENSGSGVFESRGVEAPPGFEQQAMLWWPGGVLLASLSSVEAARDGPRPAVQVVRGTLDVGRVTLPGSAGPLAAADYDGDGALDLFVGGRVESGKWPEATSSGLFRGVGAALEDVTGDAAPALRALGMVTGAAWTDVDADGDPDLLVARDMASPVLLTNDGGRLTDSTATAGLAELTGRWTGLATGDIDRDGDIDAVITNLGLNTRYSATADEPYVVFAGDVAGDGGVDVIETEWDAGKLYPIRSAVELGRQMPAFGNRFDSFLAFARAPLDTVFGADHLSRTAARYEARTLAHKLLLNDGTGTFVAEDLPSAAQLMAAYGVVIEDLDGDTDLDVYLVGNFDGPEPLHTGPYRGGVGVALQGDGAGGFASVPVAQSGLSVPEDAKGLAAADYNLDGWVDLMVGLNNRPPRLFANNGVAGRAGLTVRLLGSDGNPAGVGAKVVVRLADGTILTREVQSGSSFLSQSSPAVVFGLGSAAGPIEVTVTWPDGTTQTESAEPGSVLAITQAKS